jgi:hypothetical protein
LGLRLRIDKVFIFILGKSYELREQWNKLDKIHYLIEI